MNMSELADTITGFLAVIYFWVESIVLFFIPLKYKAKDITGELVLITGAGSGIGRLTAVKFAQRGANLVLWDINVKDNEDTAHMAREFGVKAHTYTVDISDRETVLKTAARVKQDAGVVTIMINNAGIVFGKSVLELEEQQVRKIFDVNVLAHFWTIQAFLPDMKKRDHGHIVSICSLAGLAGIPRLTDYCSTKHAAVGLMDSLCVELHSEGYKNIHSTIICPYFINTGLFNGATAKLFANLEPDYVAQQILAAVLCNKYLVLIPRSFYFLYSLRSIMPARAVLALQDVCGGSKSMSNFTGRNSKKVN